MARKSENSGREKGRGLIFETSNSLTTALAKHKQSAAFQFSCILFHELFSLAMADDLQNYKLQLQQVSGRWWEWF